MVYLIVKGTSNAFVLQQTKFRTTFPLHGVRSALHPVLSLLHHLRSPVLSLLPLSFLLLAQDFKTSPIFIIHQQVLHRQENRPSDRRQNQPRKGGCRWRWHCRHWVCLGFGSRRSNKKRNRRCLFCTCPLHGHRQYHPTRLHTITLRNSQWC